MAEPEQDAPVERRTGFGPVVLAGLASGALAAVAGTRAWVEGSSGRLSTETAGDAAVVGSAVAAGIGEMPLAGALSLVVLAGWGVVLVTRGRLRRAVMGVAALAAVGLLVTTVWAFFTLQDSVAQQLQAASGEDTSAVHLTGWYAAACVAAVGCVVTTLLAVRLVPAWPEMGRRYDAPAGDAAPAEPQGNLEIWKALDEGHDPTDRRRPLD
ncbi:Trp biosynthesis-associated membrane protein [Nocardioides sediminis]|uniref:Trp biosynthesis-associated membrane protein n=1 Tax=Nocardioides sediminis TaxID=433648 RepID=UPI000D2F4D78|nr:Trp biosynthesis-associated membrane protein [Nocardioides sediminis]